VPTCWWGFVFDFGTDDNGSLNLLYSLAEKTSNCKRRGKSSAVFLRKRAALAMALLRVTWWVILMDNGPRSQNLDRFLLIASVEGRFNG
jgi:hypothetical protein